VVAPGESARLRKVPAFGPSPAMAHVVSLRSTPCAIAPLSSWNRGEDVQEVGDGQQLRLARRKPRLCSPPLALGAMAVTAANGRRPLAALWGSIYLWGVKLKMSEAVAFSRIYYSPLRTCPSANNVALDSRNDSLLARGGAKQHHENPQFSPPGRPSPSWTSGARSRWRGRYYGEREALKSCRIH